MHVITAPINRVTTSALGVASILVGLCSSGLQIADQTCLVAASTAPDGFSLSLTSFEPCTSSPHLPTVRTPLAAQLPRHIPQPPSTTIEPWLLLLGSWGLLLLPHTFAGKICSAGARAFHKAVRPFDIANKATNKPSLHSLGNDPNFSRCILVEHLPALNPATVSEENTLGQFDERNCGTNQCAA